MMARKPKPPQVDDVDRLVDIKFIADRLKVTAETVREMVKRDEFPEPMRLRTLHRWRLSVLNTWIEGHDAQKQQTEGRQ
jgi:predicted DNA-binding transcriptional regulator AlpA